MKSINIAILIAAASAGACALIKYLSDSGKNNKKTNNSEKLIIKNDFEDLFNNQDVVQYLSANEIKEWFINEKQSGCKMYLLRLNKEIIAECKSDFSELDVDSYVIQCICNGNNEEIVKARLINFVEISPELEKLFNENNRIIEICDKDVEL